MCKGKLYSCKDEELVASVNYKLQSTAPRNWWGELIPVEIVSISDRGDYTIELENNRKHKCYLQKRVNRATIGLPPRYVYKFTGIEPLE